MKLNEFIRELTALCKEELNPEVVDEFDCSLIEVSFDEGKVILTFEADEIIFENDVQPVTVTSSSSELKIVS